MTQTAEALHPDTFPRDKFPTLYEKGEPQVLTAEELASLKSDFERNKAMAELRQLIREQNAGVGDVALNWANTALFDSPDSATDPKTKKELRAAQDAFVRLMLLLEEIGTNAPGNLDGIASFFETLSTQVVELLESRGWQSGPLHGQK